MIRRPPRSTLSSSSAASDVYKRQLGMGEPGVTALGPETRTTRRSVFGALAAVIVCVNVKERYDGHVCALYLCPCFCPGASPFVGYGYPHRASVSISSRALHACAKTCGCRPCHACCPSCSRALCHTLCRDCRCVCCDVQHRPKGSEVFSHPFSCPHRVTLLIRVTVAFFSLRHCDRTTSSSMRSGPMQDMRMLKVGSDHW